MKAAVVIALALVALFELVSGVVPPAARLGHGRFDEVTLYTPPAAVKRFVLFLSGADGWSPRMARAARALAADGSVVAGIDTPALVARLDADGDDCVFVDGDLENLSHYVQGYLRLPGYFAPYLVGDGPGAALAFETLAQAPAGTFAAALSLHFCPAAPSRTPPCAGSTGTTTRDSRRALAPVPGMPAPWRVLRQARGETCPVAAVRSFVGAVADARLDIAASGARSGQPGADAGVHELVDALRALPIPPPGARPPPALARLPLVEVPAQALGDTFAVLLSGDGGWAGLDEDVAAALAARGIGVVGFDSLRYFWQARTPRVLARDLDRIVRDYSQRWGRPRALLIGYSQGADVLPFAVNRLPAATRASLAGVILLGPGARAAFEFHVTNWLGRWFSTDAGLDTLPEFAGLDPALTLCVYGREDTESVCPRVAAQVRTLQLAGGHHFDGEYDALTARMLAALREPGPPR